MRTTVAPDGRRRQAPRALAAAFLLVALLAAPSPGRGDELSSGPFRVLFPSGREKTARFLLDEADLASRSLARELGGSLDRPVTIVLLTGEERDPGLPPWAAGAAEPGRQVIWLRTSSALGRGPSDLKGTLRHELAHVYLDLRTGGRALPRWLEEGIAQRQAGGLGLVRRLIFSAGAIGGRLPRLDDLAYRFPSEERAAAQAYGVALRFTGYLQKEGGPDSLPHLLDLLAAGEDFRTAFRRVFGLTPREMETAWRRSTTWWTRIVAAAAGGTFFWGLAALLTVAASVRKYFTDKRKLAEMDEDDWPLH